MFNIADLPAVQAQLAQDATAAKQSAAGAPAATLQEESDETQPEQALGYPSKNLILVNGRYQAVGQKM
ncbi:hypothetical protein ACHAC9_22310 [Massilia sp. CMS3.1]|uniref:hypothetical protein n=1 Tax=Massilia sp. CMS3.1 TaxID=3373083 RepID=UPI003EE7C5AC